MSHWNQTLLIPCLYKPSASLIIPEVDCAYVVIRSTVMEGVDYATAELSPTVEEGLRWSEGTSNITMSTSDVERPRYP